MAHSLTGSISTVDQLTGSISTTGSIQATAVSVTPTQRLSDLADIDITNREDGSMVIWDEVSQTFKVQGELEHPKLFIGGGSF